MTPQRKTPSEGSHPFDDHSQISFWAGIPDGTAANTRHRKSHSLGILTESVKAFAFPAALLGECQSFAGMVSSRTSSSQSSDQSKNKTRCAMVSQTPALLQSSELNVCYPPIEVRVRRVKRRSQPVLAASEMVLPDAASLPSSAVWSSIRRATMIAVGVSFATVAVSIRHFVSSGQNQLQRQAQIENRHPLSVAAASNRRRQLRAASVTTTTISSWPSHTADNQKLHYLSFGSSNTWGAELSHSASNTDTMTAYSASAEAAETTTHTTTTATYPNLLDSNVLTVALPASRVYADLAAACTQSLVEGSTVRSTGTATPNQSLSSSQRTTAPPVSYSPDVITVEYSTEITASHMVLLQRLRRRYPTAKLVLVRLFQPATQLFFVSAQGGANGTTIAPQSLQSWLSQNSNVHSASTLARSMFLAAADGSSRWSVLPDSSDTPQKLERALRKDPLLLHYGGLASPVSVPTTEEEWSSFLGLFTDSVTDLSYLGHERVARDIQSLVDSAPRRTMPSARSTTAVSDGTWGSGDECNLWYATGNYKLESTGQPVNLPVASSSVSAAARSSASSLALASPTAVASLSPASHKHVLEFAPKPPRSNGTASKKDVNKSDKDRDNQVTVHNPFSTDRLLSLTYLTDADGMTYPRTRVVLNGVPTLVIHPIHNGQSSQRLSATSIIEKEGVDGQVTRTTGVGYIPPGTSTIRLDPLQSTHSPFRLLGASILAEEVSDLTSIEFSLEAE